MDKLGRITLEVWDAIHTTPAPVASVIADAQVSERIVCKKGASRCGYVLIPPHITVY